MIFFVEFLINENYDFFIYLYLNINIRSRLILTIRQVGLNGTLTFTLTFSKQWIKERISSRKYNMVMVKSMNPYLI